MATAAAFRLVPLSVRNISRASLPVRPALRPQICQWKAGARRSFASTSLLSKKYTEDHEWIEMDSDGKTGTIGITEYAAQQLGDVVYVELPEIGLEIKKGDAMGAVESVKSASDIMTPVTGKIVDHNKVLEETPGKINKDPEGDAWLAKIEVSDTSEMDSLMDKDGYTAFTENADE